MIGADPTRNGWFHYADRGEWSYFAKGRILATVSDRYVQRLNTMHSAVPVVFEACGATLIEKLSW